VVVRPADKHDFLACPPHVTDESVCGDVRSQVPEVTGSVCVREAAGNQERWYH
jgi:hypothetical protein